MNSELYKELYKFEWEQRTHLSSAINIPIVAITALATALATISMAYRYSFATSSILFAACAIASAVFLFFALAFVLCSLLAAEYKKMPSPSILKQYHSSLSEWHIRHGGDNNKADTEFNDLFNSALATAAEYNGSKNRFRGNCIYLASLLIGISLLPLTISGVLYVSASINQPDKVQKIYIVPKP